MEIASIVNMPLNIVKDKIRSLRTVFFQNYNKQVKSGKRSVKWEFYNALMFLIFKIDEAAEFDPLSVSTYIQILE